MNRVTTFRLAFAVAFCLSFSTFWAQAQATAAASETSEGEKLERLMASDIQAKNWKAVEARIADGFQSVHPDGVRDRAGEIALLKGMNFGAFTLSNFKSTTIGRQHRRDVHYDSRGNNRWQTITRQTCLSVERVEKRSERLAMDQSRKFHSDSVER